MKYSIIIPLYNKVHHVITALESVCRQTINDYEVIIVDDGSTDSGKAAVEQFIADKPRFHLIQQKNSGVASARNTGIAHSCGEYIAFLDADDIWLPNHLAEINHLAEQYPHAGIYSTAYELYWQETETKKKAHFFFLPPKQHLEISNYFFSAYQGNPVWTSVTVIPQKILQKYGVFIDGGARGEDLELWGRIACYETIAFSRQVTARYRQDGENRSDNPQVKKLQRLELIDRDRWWVSSILEQWIKTPGISCTKKFWIREWIIKYELLEKSKISKQKKIFNIFSFSFFYVIVTKSLKKIIAARSKF